MNKPTITKIIKTQMETKDIKTLKFYYPGKMSPGQFFMIWIPGVDEIPMSASYINKEDKGITFKKVGAATSALFKMNKGDKIGVRGPYGNGFNIKRGKTLFIGGGTGIATITVAVEFAANKKFSSDVIIGVKNKKELFFENRLKKFINKVYVSTDDGSKGYKGFASDLTKHLLSKNKYTSVLTCGPEIMMKQILSACKDTQFQASIERYMKCSVGLCGQCCLGNGLRVCKEGPVFDGKTLKKIPEFGVYKRDASGRKIKFK